MLIENRSKIWKSMTHEIIIIIVTRNDFVDDFEPMRTQTTDLHIGQWRKPVQTVDDEFVDDIVTCGIKCAACCRLPFQPTARQTVTRQTGIASKWDAPNWTASNRNASKRTRQSGMTANQKLNATSEGYRW